nr:hypothetical protein [Sinorhizobium sp. M4_45]
MTYLEEESERGIQLFMAEYAVNREDALRLIVRDWLGSHGYLALTEDESELGKEPRSMTRRRSAAPRAARRFSPSLLYVEK